MVFHLGLIGSLLIMEAMYAFFTYILLGSKCLEQLANREHKLV